MAGELYLLLVTVLLVAALAVAVPVLAGIVRDGRERLRQPQSGPAERDAGDDAEGDAGDPAPDEGVPVGDLAVVSGTRTCPNCGADNSAEFAYCRECAERL